MAEHYDTADKAAARQILIDKALLLFADRRRLNVFTLPANDGLCIRQFRAELPNALYVVGLERETQIVLEHEFDIDRYYVGNVTDFVGEQRSLRLRHLVKANFDTRWGKGVKQAVNNQNLKDDTVFDLAFLDFTGIPSEALFDDIKAMRQRMADTFVMGVTMTLREADDVDLIRARFPNEPAQHFHPYENAKSNMIIFLVTQ